MYKRLVMLGLILCIILLCLGNVHLKDPNGLKFLEAENLNANQMEERVNLADIIDRDYLEWEAAKNYCLASNGTIVNSTAIFDTSRGYVEGINSKFCFIENSHLNCGMIDLNALVSKNPSIAATYVLKGIDLDNIPSPTSIQDICQVMKGTSIGFYTDGGYSNPYGIDEICVFADDSKVSTWVLIYISMDPDYLNLRARINSQPLPLSLPYLGNGEATDFSSEIKGKLLYKHLFSSSMIIPSKKQS